MKVAESRRIPSNLKLPSWWAPDKRGKREVYCDKQVGKAVTVLNCVLKSSWGEGGSRGIRKKLKSEYTTYLESKYRRNDGSSI